MDPSRGVSAAEWIASADEDEIARVFKDYGEERFAKRMARAVVQRRAEAPFERTADLAKVLTDANPAWEKGKNPATRAFQGLRIHINNELGDLGVVSTQRWKRWKWAVAWSSSASIRWKIASSNSSCVGTPRARQTSCRVTCQSSRRPSSRV